jgi:hypothetical protein
VQLTKWKEKSALEFWFNPVQCKQENISGYGREGSKIKIYGVQLSVRIICKDSVSMKQSIRHAVTLGLIHGSGGGGGHTNNRWVNITQTMWISGATVHGGAAWIKYHLTLIRMAGGVFDSRNFEQIQLKMAWSKNIFTLFRSILHKMYWNYILLKVFVSRKYCFRLFFNQKGRTSSCFWYYFCVFQLAGSHLTPRWPIGVRWRGWGFSQRALPHSYLSPGSHTWLPAAWLRTFYSQSY